MLGSTVDGWIAVLGLGGSVRCPRVIMSTLAITTAAHARMILGKIRWFSHRTGRIRSREAARLIAYWPSSDPPPCPVRPSQFAYVVS